MKSIFYKAGLLVLLPVLLYINTSTRLPDDNNKLLKHETGPGFVVMELFTSQGCSSCPPADEILGSYALKKNTQIFPIVFHVDYWNRLGWIDSLSNNSYSQRQQDYGEKFYLGSVYTPQLIVNGQRQMNGSNKNKIESAVDIYLHEKAAIQINITGISLARQQVVVNYEVSELLSGLDMIAVLVQKQVVTQINAGENRGLKLTNYNVARDLKSNALKQLAGSFNMDMPVGNDPVNYKVILFVQDKKTGSIKAAAGKDCQ